MLYTPASSSRRLKSFAIRCVFFPTAVPRSLVGRERKYLAFLPDKQAGEQESKDNLRTNYKTQLLPDKPARGRRFTLLCP
jgi:hypothetical protein